MKLVFMGTPDFAVPSLKNLVQDSSLDIRGVVTQPDRPKGRGNKLTAPPIKKVALDFGLEVYQPDSINTEEAYARFVEWDPDVIVVVAFGQILKAQVLELPHLGCINVHASLLPRYRGAAPIHWAIINGETKTGITTMFMDQGLDTGDIILQEATDIGCEETTGELHDRLAVMGGSLLLRTLHLLEKGEVPRIPQEDGMSSYAPVIKREHEVVDWGQSAARIVNHIRGLNPWPGTYTTMDNRILKLWRSRIWEKEKVIEDSVPGQVVDVGNKGIIVQAGKGQILLTELQMQNHKRMSAESFLRGNDLRPGNVLGGASPNAGNKNS